ncbi:MAG TPA: hypothetical protein VNC14_04070 [Lapillicoccus sp.]|jgi:hypothetical protein|nr:hypothetical protein [Lapillicoccus sp.]
MRRPGMVVGGVLLVVVGAVWTLQGLGYLPGSVMSGVTFWAVIGPVVAVVGLVFIARGWSGRGARPPDDGRPGA